MNIDFENRKITTKDSEIHLTKIENEIFKSIYNSKDKPKSMDEIIEEVYKIKSDKWLENNVRVHISKIRKKLNKCLQIKNRKKCGFYIKEIE